MAGVVKARPRHLTPGWCWRADIDDDPSVWGIYGHVSDAEARAIVEAYEGEPIGAPTVTRDHRRSVPCRRDNCPCDGGRHLEPADGPGRGAGPSWVEVVRHTPAEWHGAIPARECDPDARAAALEAELPGIIALRNSGRWPFLLTDDQAARAAEDTIDPFFFIDEQIKREERVRDEQEDQW